LTVRLSGDFTGAAPQGVAPVDISAIENLIMANETTKKPVWLSTGNTLLNLALANRRGGGLSAGKYYMFVGDSSSGKTWVTLQILAEAARNDAFAKHQLIFDNVENGALMDISRYFGNKLAARITSPCEDGRNSTTIESFYTNIHKVMDRGPCVYVLDSMDSLTSEASQKKLQQRISATKKTGEVGKLAGEMMDGKAKANSQQLRQVIDRLAADDSILIIICQTRDNIDPFSFETQTRAGGNALKFYAAAEMWTKIVKKLHKTHHEKRLNIGHIVRVSIKKNRLTGKDWSVDIPMYFTAGLDETESMLNFLVEVGRIRVGDKGRAEVLGISGTKEKIIAELEASRRLPELRELVWEAWQKMEAAVTVTRVPRYE